MTAPLPLTPADLSALARLVETAWPDCARKAGVDPDNHRVGVGQDGALWCYPIEIGKSAVPSARWAALEELARDLEDEGWAVARDGGSPRVVGWAAVVEMVVRESEEFGNVVEPAPVRIVDLDARDPRRLAHFDALTAARLAARQGPAANVKREHGRATARMARGGR